MTSPRLDAGSFRDREGRVFYHRGGVYRALSGDALAAWRELAATDFFQRTQDDGTVVATHEVDLSAGGDSDGALTAAQLAALSPRWAGALAHQRIPFLSYPYEWSFTMLRDAARLQLDLLLAALEEALTIKDASSYNVQWHGARPVFIDVASFEPWRPGSPWMGYLQFCQLFLYPLFLTAYRDVDFQPWLRGAVDGIAPAAMSRLLGSWRDRLRPGVFADVFLLAKLQARQADRRRPLRDDLRRAGFSKAMIANNVRRLRKVVDKLRWRRAGSTWADYADDTSYDAENRRIKEDFVAAAAAERHWPLVWDLGCNTGAYSRIAAAHAGTVVAVDGDHLAIDRLYRALRAEGPANVLPLVISLTDASPGLGWRGVERKALTDRARPDLVLCLALIHHLVLAANLPLAEVVDWLAALGGHLVIEWVDKDDPQARRLLANKDDIYHDYTRAAFEAALAERFTVARRQTFHHGTRTLYLARPRPDA